ncbi:MAG TPA: serine hydrolase [Vicinamibacterales bacterium]|nr:serine hydrolase [Vicinamibacterales bacterium]
MTRRLSYLSLSVLVAAAGLLARPALAQTSGVALERGRAVAGNFAEGATPVRYTIAAGEDTFLSGEVNQISVNVVVRILDPKGTPVGRFNGPSRGPERFSRRLRQAGTYQIEVAPFEKATGDYAITLLRLEPLEKDPRKLTDQLLSPYAGNDRPGAAVQVWRDGRTLYSAAYGMASLVHGVPFTTSTRTNIGSTSKQFTAAAIMLLAQRGALSLGDDVRKHIPELPAFDQTITVRHLLTHTSGLREFLNLLLMSGRRLDHGDWIDRREIIDIVKRQPALQNAPGAEFNYNNTAFGLAAVIVERTSGEPFHEFVRKNIFEPLDMTRSMVRPSREHIVPESSEGYRMADDGYQQTGDLAGAVGAGGIYASVEDLQRWVQNYASPRVGTAGMFTEMMTPFTLADGKSTGYGYGLFIDEQRGLKRVHHGGADAAHRSMVVYYPDINAGLTVQSNDATFTANVAFDLAEAYFADAMKPPADASAATGGTFDPASFDPQAFDPFVGRYALDEAPTFILTFSRDGSTFYAQATGQPRFQIVPTSPTTFRLLQVEASVEFERNADGKVTGLTLVQNGRRHGTRLEEAAPAPWRPTADELEAFVGRYFSEEVETFYTLTIEDDALVVRHRRLDQFRLRPGEADRFTGGPFTVAFERDRNGRVIGFYLANGRTRDVRFERVR